MDDFLRRLSRLHRRDLPVEPEEAARSTSPPTRLLNYLLSSSTSPDYLGNFTLPNETTSTTSFPVMIREDEGGHVRSNDSFPLSSFAVIKAAVLAIVLGILLLTSCRVVGKIVCKNSNKDQSE